jgi:uncharacterized protein YndB with AHSA1/START domain
MSTWTRQHTVHTTADPAQVWARWTDASTWSVDDPGVAWVVLDEHPRTGSRGRLRSHGSPAQGFVFTEVEPERRMDLTLRLPWADLSITHAMDPTPAGLAVTHGVRLDGPLAPAYALLVGRRLVAGLPQVVRTVVAAALDATPAPRG